MECFISPVNRVSIITYPLAIIFYQKYKVMFKDLNIWKIQIIHVEPTITLYKLAKILGFYSPGKRPPFQYLYQKRIIEVYDEEDWGICKHLAHKMNGLTINGHSSGENEVILHLFVGLVEKKIAA